MRRALRLALPAMFCGVLVAAVAPTPASAHYFGAVCGPFGAYYNPIKGKAYLGVVQTCTSYANNDWHTIKFGGTIDNQLPGVSAASIWAITEQYVMRTDLRGGYDANDSIPDVVVHDGFYGDIGAVAWTECSAEKATTRIERDFGYICVGQEVRYNSEFREYYDTRAERRGIACHELGHTVGLQHSDEEPIASSCMVFGFPGEGGMDAKPNTLGTHEINHINAYYQ